MAMVSQTREKRMRLFERKSN